MLSLLAGSALSGSRGTLSPCHSCVAGCCRSFALAVEGFDVYRIWRDLRLSPVDFAELRWVEERDADHRILLDPDPEARRYHRLMLVRVDDALPEHPQRCIFLISVGSDARCGIYHSRPSMCRTYPSYVEDGVIGASGGKYCPPGSWRLQTLDVPLIRARLQFKARQHAIYERLVDAWNARLLATGERREASDFLHFLVNAYSELEERDGSWFEEGAPGQPERLEAGAIDDGVRHLVAALGWAKGAAE